MPALTVRIARAPTAAQAWREVEAHAAVVDAVHVAAALHRLVPGRRQPKLDPADPREQSGHPQGAPTGSDHASTSAPMASVRRGGTALPIARASWPRLRMEEKSTWSGMCCSRAASWAVMVRGLVGCTYRPMHME